MSRRAAAALVGGAVLLLALAWWARSRDERTGPGGPVATKPVAEPAPFNARRPAQAAPAPPPRIASDADPVGTLRLEGQVVDDAGEPVAGARVTVSAVPPRSAISEADGSFHLDALVGRHYQVWARAGEQIGGPVSYQLTADSDPVVVRIAAGAAVDVTVVDSAGRPIAGAAVSISGGLASSGTTGADGVAALRGVESGWLIATATAAGHARAEQLVQVPAATSAPIAIRLVLGPGVSVSGTVVDERGAPVHGATVRATRVAELIPIGASGATATSAADGRFTIEALAPGTYRLVATHADMEPVGTEPIAVDARGAARAIVIAMRAGAVLAGVVADGDGAPVSWATVRVGPAQPDVTSAGSLTRQVVADEAGRFRMSGLARQPTLAVASSAAAASDAVRFDLATTRTIEDAHLVLGITGTIAGRVVDGRGEPVPEVQVSAFPDFWAGGLADDFHVRGEAATVSGADGGFALRGLPQGTFRIRAIRSNASARTSITQGVQAATGDRDVRVVLEADGSIRGVIRFEDGTPATVFSVAVTWPPGVPFAGDDGSFTLSAIPPGTFDLTFRGPTFAEKVVRDVAVRADELTDLGTVTVRRGRIVAGRVTDATGAGVDGAVVVVARQLIGDGTTLAAELGTGVDEQLSLRRTQTDASGAYRIAGIASEELFIAAEHSDYGRSPGLRLAPGTADASADLALVPFGAIEGRATVGGKPAPGATVVAAPTGRQSEAIIVRAGMDGRYVIERAPAGSYNVLLQVGAGVGAKTGSTGATVEPGATVTADIDIPIGEVTLTVTLAGKDGAEVSTGQLFLFEGEVVAANGKQLTETFTARAGSASMMKLVTGGAPAVFADLVPGAYTLCVVPLAGDLDDPSFMQRVQAHASALRVDCLPAPIAASPTAQSLTATVAPMDPLPE